jgi:hypothetical protein
MSAHQRNYVRKAIESTTKALTAQEIGFIANTMAGANWGTAAITARIREIKDEHGRRFWGCVQVVSGDTRRWVYARKVYGYSHKDGHNYGN